MPLTSYTNKTPQKPNHTMTTAKKTVTVKFTASEAEWILNKLQRIASDSKEKGRFEEQFRAENLIDHIQSEQ